MWQTGIRNQSYVYYQSSRTSPRFEISGFTGTSGERQTDVGVRLYSSGTVGVSSAWNRASGLRTVKSAKSDTPTHQVLITKRLPLLFHTGTDGSVPPRSAASVNIGEAEGPSDYLAVRLFPQFFYVTVPHTKRT